MLYHTRTAKPLSAIIANELKQRGYRGIFEALTSEDERLDGSEDPQAAKNAEEMVRTPSSRWPEGSSAKQDRTQDKIGQRTPLPDLGVQLHVPVIQDSIST